MSNHEIDELYSKWRKRAKHDGLSLREASELSGISEKDLEKLIKTGELPEKPLTKKFDVSLRNLATYCVQNAITIPEIQTK